MNDVLVGEAEKGEIRDQVERILKDLGWPEPPINLADVRSLLQLDLQYYRSSDPGLITELTHRFKLLARKTIPDAGKHLLNALAKSGLCAFWVPDSSRILVDQDVHVLKHRWIEAHEITHSVTEWHKDFLLGDNAQTLDPTCHAVLEAEANYGAGQLLFLQTRFSGEARDLSLTFDSIKHLAKRYSNSLVSTFWRMVEDRDPSQPVFGVISVHPHHADIGAHDGPEPWRHFIRSNAFRLQFANVSPAAAYNVVVQAATYRKRGPVALVHLALIDVAGRTWEFQIESFSTGYDLLTLGFPLRELHTTVFGGL